MRQRASVLGLAVCSVAALLVSIIGVVPAEARETAQAVPGMRYMNDVWCRSDGTCLGVGSTPEGAGAVVLLRAVGASGPVRPVAGTTELNGIVCPATGNCIAVGSGPGETIGVVVEVDPTGMPGAVRTVSGTDGLLDVACPTAGTCVATGLRTITVRRYPYYRATPQYVVITNGQPAPPQGFPSPATLIVGISCPTATTCLGVGNGYIAVLSDANGTWSATVPPVTGSDLEGYPLEAISCPSPSICHATAAGFVPFFGGYIGVPAIVPISPTGVAGSVQNLTNRAGLAYGISCVGTRSGACTVVGQASEGLVVEVAGGSPRVVTFWGPVRFKSVSCVAARSCGIVGDSGAGGVFAWYGPPIG